MFFLDLIFLQATSLVSSDVCLYADAVLTDRVVCESIARTKEKEIGQTLMSSKVLLVDDSGVMRKIILRSLNAIGVTEVTEAGDGDEAWEIFQRGEFDLVLTDWNMPNMSGLEFLKLIRGSGATLPVVLVTTESEKERVVEAIQAGVTDYLTKPFDNDVLRDKILKHLPCAT